MIAPQSSGPHADGPILISGNTDNPTKALILLHGRGASAASILTLADELSLPSTYVVIAPQANDHSWYPQRFTVPTAHNQPYLDSALDKIAAILDSLKAHYSIDATQVVLAGFSQGACLVSTFITQHPRRYQGVAIFSGGLIGDDTEVSNELPGDLSHTPVYIGCDVADFHIPQNRVERTAEVLGAMHANVQLKLYEGLGHTIHPEGIAALQAIVAD